METQAQANKYYDRFSKVYDLVSPKRYYHKPRKASIEELGIESGDLVLNIPCGTGQNFEYFIEYFGTDYEVFGIDISKGMLEVAKAKTVKNQWDHIKLYNGDAREINRSWVDENIKENLSFDKILVDLGLSGFPEWEKVIDDLISLLKPNGRIVVMDWYIEKPSLRGALIKWIGKGEVNRPVWQYLEKRTKGFKVDNSFKGGDMFVASGSKP